MSSRRACGSWTEACIASPGLLPDWPKARARGSDMARTSRGSWSKRPGGRRGAHLGRSAGGWPGRRECRCVRSRTGILRRAGSPRRIALRGRKALAVRPDLRPFGADLRVSAAAPQRVLFLRLRGRVPRHLRRGPLARRAHRLCVRPGPGGYRTRPCRKGPSGSFCIVNAPATGDIRQFTPEEIEQCTDRSFDLLARCGLKVERRTAAMTTTTPSDYDRLFPGTGGALYGRASHGWMASFARPGSRSRIPGLYLAGAASIQARGYRWQRFRGAWRPGA